MYCTSYGSSKQLRSSVPACRGMSEVTLARPGCAAPAGRRKADDFTRVTSEKNFTKHQFEICCSCVDHLDNCTHQNPYTRLLLPDLLGKFCAKPYLASTTSGCVLSSRQFHEASSSGEPGPLKGCWGCPAGTY